ncbi:O-antigen ligase family protein [Candidatus Acetothermia bacterium]|nr:O-antigen ligase family protein [Candidatus Acetothermia bacterium]MBI3642672.1 O-antigen ligase family protein [Candidatus Acetothermia bacterium]
MKNKAKSAPTIQINKNRFAELQLPISKKSATISIGLATFALASVFAAQADFNPAYLVVLTGTSLLWLVWALPNVPMGLAAILFFAQPLVIPMLSSDASLPKLIFTILMISLMLALWAADKILQQKCVFQLTSLIWPGIGLLSAATISLINSISFIVDFPYIPLILYFGLFILLLANLLKEPGQVRFLLGAILTSLLLSAIFSQLQYFGLLAGFQGRFGGTNSILSTLGNRNYLAGCLAYLYPAGLILYFQTKSRWLRGLALTALVLIFATLYAIDSDSAWLAFSLAIITLLAGLSLSGELIHLHQLRARGLALVCATLAGVGLFFAGTILWVTKTSLTVSQLISTFNLFTPVTWIALCALGLLILFVLLGRSIHRHPRRWAVALSIIIGIAVVGAGMTPIGKVVSKRAEKIAAQNTSQLRAQFWWVAYGIFKDHPLIGTGLGDYKREYLAYKGQFLQTPLGPHFINSVQGELPVSNAHNEFIQLGAEMGILGLLAVVLFIGAIAQRAVRVIGKEGSAEKRWLAIGSAAGIVAVIVDSLFSFPLHLPTNALILSLLLGVLCSEAMGRGQRVIQLRKAGAYLLAGILLIVALAAGGIAYRAWIANRDFSFGQALLGRGDERGAAYLQRSIAMGRSPGEAYYVLGFWNFNQKEYRPAKEFLEKSMPLYPREYTYFMLAAIAGQQGDFAAAQRLLDTLLAFNPDPILKNKEIPYLQALLFNEAGQPEQAIPLLEKLLAIGYQPEKIHLDLADIYLKEKNPRSAREEIQLSLKLIEDELDEIGITGDPARRKELLDLQKSAQDELRQL